MNKKPIEVDFPIEEVNEIAEREAHAKEKYRPIYFIHKWWARRLGSVFRTIVFYSFFRCRCQASQKRSVAADNQG